MFHVTQVKRAMKEWLVLQLPGALAAADEEVADGITTPPPYEVHTTDKADIGGLPSIEIVALSSVSQADSSAQQYRHAVVLGLTVGGDDEETISAQIERYMWVLRQLLRDTQLNAPGTAPVQVGTEQYAPFQRRPELVETPLVKGAMLETFITTVE